MSNSDEANNVKISNIIDSIATIEDQKKSSNCFNSFVVAYVDLVTSLKAKRHDSDDSNRPTKTNLMEQQVQIVGSIRNTIKTELLSESDRNEIPILTNGEQQNNFETCSTLGDTYTVLRSSLRCPVPKPVSLVPKASEEQRSILPDRNPDSEVTYPDVSRVKVEVTEDDVVPVVIQEDEEEDCGTMDKVMVSKLPVTISSNVVETSEKVNEVKKKKVTEYDELDHDGSICGLEMETDENSEALPNIDFSKPGPSFGPVTRSSRTSRMTMEDENCTLELSVDEEVVDEAKSESLEQDIDEEEEDDSENDDEEEEEEEEEEEAEKEDETPTNLILCRFCGQKVKISEFEGHKKKHEGEPSFLCEVCDERFATEPRLESHFRRLHTGDHKCDLCEKTFSSKDGLKTHHKVHLDDRPYKCKVCDKAFKTRQSQYHHRKVHSDKKPYQCDLCGKKFKYKQLYKVHKEKVHDNIIQTHTCVTCGKVYRNPQSLFRHQKHHSSDTRRHECDVCGRKFFEPHHLRKHHLIHDGIKPFECNVCHKSFRQKETLTHHLKVIHPLAGNLISNKNKRKSKQSTTKRRPQNIQPKLQVQCVPNCVVVVAKGATGAY